jgi:hypothetical protein
MVTGILGTFITLLLIKLNIYPAVRGEPGGGSCPNLRLFSECPCTLLRVRGKSRKLPELSYPNNHTSVKSKGVDFTGIHCVLSVEKVEKGSGVLVCRRWPWSESVSPVLVEVSLFE